MRAAPIGAFFRHAPDHMTEFVSVCTRVTHVDPRAEVGAQAVAALARFGMERSADARPEPRQFVELLRSVGGNCAEWNELVSKIESALARDDSVSRFADSLDLANGVSGYVYHTVPVVAYAWLRHFGDFRAALESVLDCGGDTDTTGAIVGALSGASVGLSGTPENWVAGVADWPRSIQY